MYNRILLLSALLIFAVSPTPGGADGTEENNCGKRNTILSFLSTKYSEKPIAMGVAANGGLIEVLSSNEGSTFTIVVTMPKGNTCMVAAGEGWELLQASRKPQI
jgi:hypothetical protein